MAPLIRRIPGRALVFQVVGADGVHRVVVTNGIARCESCSAECAVALDIEASTRRLAELVQQRARERDLQRAAEDAERRRAAATVAELPTMPTSDVEGLVTDPTVPPRTNGPRGVLQRFARRELAQRDHQATEAPR